MFTRNNSPREKDDGGGGSQFTIGRDEFVRFQSSVSMMKSQKREEIEKVLSLASSGNTSIILQIKLFDFSELSFLLSLPLTHFVISLSFVLTAISLILESLL